MATSLCTPSYSNFLNLNNGTQLSHHKLNSFVHYTPRFRFNTKISCSNNNNNDTTKPQQSQSQSIQLYSQIEKLVTTSARQSQDAWWGSTDWTEVEGSWILKPKSTKPNFVVHFVGGIFVGAAPQLTYRWFLERLSER